MFGVEQQHLKIVVGDKKVVTVSDSRATRNQKWQVHLVFPLSWVSSVVLVYIHLSVNVFTRAASFPFSLTCLCGWSVENRRRSAVFHKVQGRTEFSLQLFAGNQVQKWKDCIYIATIQTIFHRYSLYLALSKAPVDVKSFTMSFHHVVAAFVRRSYSEIVLTYSCDDIYLWRNVLRSASAS